MLKLRNNYQTIMLLNLAILIVLIYVFALTTNNKTETIEINTGQVSNKKICWGIKKNSLHEQPDVGSANKKILEDNNGICLGNKDEKIIYLTFDNGYEAGYTNQILDTLKQNEVKATFFITAHYLNSASEIVQRMIDEGHIVGNHTPISLMSGNNIEVKC